MFILALKSVVLKLVGGGGGGECSVVNEARNDRGRTLIINARIKFEVKNKCNLLYSVFYLSTHRPARSHSIFTISLAEQFHFERKRIN